MRVLVIDTALGACTAAVFQDGAPVAERFEPMARGHQERLGGLARDVVEAAGGFDGLDRIGVTVGPGSFTGLRVGLAFAQGLATALDRPVVGVSTLDALAASVEPDGLVAALIDARRDQFYLRLFRDGAALGPAEALPIRDALERITGEARGPATLVGSGAALAAELRPADRVHPLVAPTPQSLARLTAQADPGSHPPRPLYLRAPDALPPSRTPGQTRPSRS
jgi:tRNA threonylcarbamoyladenosine biosynthesis protein TsaB